MRTEAARRLEAEWLRRWWCEKYKRPSKDPLLLEYSPEELMVEFLEDLIEKDPYQEYPQSVAQDGSFVKHTGDAVADAWADEIAQGRTPDFLAAFDAEDRAKIEGMLSAAKQKREAMMAPEQAPFEFHEDFAKGIEQ